MKRLLLLSSLSVLSLLTPYSLAAVAVAPAAADTADEFGDTDLSDLTGMEVYDEPNAKGNLGDTNASFTSQPKQPLSQYAVHRCVCFFQLVHANAFSLAVTICQPLIL